MTDIEKTAQQPTACFRELEIQHHTDHIFNVAGISPPSKLQNTDKLKSWSHKLNGQ